MEKYSDWLYLQLENDGVIDTDEVDVSEITEEFLLESTELEKSDLDNYVNQFAEHCKTLGCTPIFDVEEID